MNQTTRSLLCAALMSALFSPLVQADCNANIPLTRPDGRYVDHGDGTVTDTVTGLMWKQCSEGQSGSGCATGSAALFTWGDALQRVVNVNAGSASENLGYEDWRLPNLKELRSLVETACYSPAINTTLFPATPSTGFWPSSPRVNDSATRFAWVVFFDYGYDDLRYKFNYHPRVRLVRAGQ
jgi:hypothetical protein